MPYSVAWNESFPTGASAANAINTYITNDKIAVRERIDSVFGTSGATSLASADPYRGVTLYLNGSATAKIIPGATSLAIRDSADGRNNLLVVEAGDVTTYRDLTVGRSAVITNNLTVQGQGLSERNTVTVAGTTTVDFNSGNVHFLNLTTNITTLTLSNPVAGGCYMLEIKQGAGPYTIAWPATVKWAYGAAAPTLTSTSGRTDIISLYYNGTNYAAIIVGQNYAI